MVYGKLSRRSSIYETLLFLTSKLPRLYKRHYTLEITTPDRNLKQLQFSIPGRVDLVPVNSGDLVSILYTMQGYVMKKLVVITNHTTGKRYVLPTPIPSPVHQIVVLSAAMSGLLVVSVFSGISIVLTSAASALVILAYLKLTHTAQFTSPPLEDCGATGRRLASDQRLLVQQFKLQQRIEELTHDCKTNHLLLDQINHLKQKMASVDSHLYGARIYRATTAMTILNQQIVNNQRLIREYRRALNMIDIEIDTSWIADQLPDADDFSRKILHRLDELQEIEAQNQFLKFQLAAYEEVKNEGIQAYGV
jgi:hypothetical protein